MAGSSIRTPESIAKLVKLTVTTLSLPASRINIGAMQYITSALTLTLNTSYGPGYLDVAGGPAAGSLYYVYAVVSSGTVYLIASLNSSLPAGFTAARVVGGFTTNSSSQIDQVGEYPGNLAVAGSVSAGTNIAAEDNRNYIINGAFDFWQRGAGSTTIGYLADRFYCDRYVTTNSISRVDLTPGTTPGGSRYYQNNVVVSPGTGLSRCAQIQYVEDVTLLAGKTVVLSFWAKADSTKKLGLTMVQGFGTGGSPSADVITGGRNITITSGWQRYSAVFTLPSTVGKTFGTTANTSYTGIYIWFDGSSAYDSYTGSMGYQSGTFGIAEIMLNVGTTAAPFRRSGGTIGGELSLCQRYYEKGTVRFDGNVGTGLNSSTPIVYKVTKRVATGCSVTNSSAVNMNTTVNTISETADGIYTFHTATATTGGNFIDNWVMDAEF